MKNPEFDWLKRLDDTSEFLEFIDPIPEKDGAKLLSVVHNVEVKGLYEAIKMEWVKKLTGEIYELRSKVGSNIQRALYFHVVDNQYKITHGFTKKTQKTPQQEIEHAVTLMRLFMEGKLK
jgi:phage-related protein